MAEHVRKPIQVTDPVHERLSELVRERSKELGRAVTFSEVIERLLWHAGTPVKAGDDR